MKELHEKLLKLNGKTHEMSVTMDVDLGSRFLAKLALGLGCLFLNENYKRSADASLLRQFMWSRKKEERDKIPIHGSGFFSAERMKEVISHLNWDGGHIINLMAIGDSLALYTNFYGQNGSLMQISNDPSHWKGKINESMLFIILPEMQKYVGPISMIEFIGHKYSDYKNSDMLQLESDIANIPPNPPLG